MSGNKKQKKHSKKLAEERKIRNAMKKNEEIIEETESQIITKNIETQCDIKPKKKSTIECAFSTLASGNTFSSAQRFCVNMNYDFVSKSGFYNGQKVVSQKVNEYAEESMAQARNQTTEGSLVSGDGRYPIRRNASHCSFDIIDCHRNKILSLGTVDKQSIFHPDEKFKLASNMMESEAMKRAINQLGETKNNIDKFALDGDNKNKKILQSDDFHPTVCKDPNHLSINFGKYLDEELKKYKSMIPDQSDCFFKLRKKIKKWYNILIHDKTIDVLRKKEAWKNTVEHLKGNHKKCLPHKNTNFTWTNGIFYPDVAKKLKEILDKKLSDFDDVVPLGNTQKNESFHKEQLIFGDKSINCPVSQITRDKLAVLHHNEGPIFQLEMRNRLDLPPLDYKNNLIINTWQKERMNNSIERSTPEYRIQEALYRKDKSKRNKNPKNGDYKPKEDSE